MITYKAIVEYNGKNYFGWQVQNDVRTIQGEIESTLKRLCGDRHFRTLGASRTDRGVHALGQVCRIDFPDDLKIDDLKYTLNSMLPKDIKICHLEKVPADFHPIFHTKKKTYDYLFSFGGEANCFQDDFFAHCIYDLDMDVMEKACNIIIGEHDFINYFCTGSDVPSTVRTIFQCHIKKLSDHEYYHFLLPEAYCITIEGSGFLKQMVRLLVGAIWATARGQVSLDEFKESLSGKKRESRIGPVAPGSGLYLREIVY